MALAKEAQDEALKNNRHYTAAFSWEVTGWIYQFNGHWDSSVHYLEKAHRYFAEHGYKTDVLNTDIELAEVYNKQSRFSEALECLVEGDALSCEINNKRKQANIKRMLGVVYRGMRDNEKAQLYFKEAMSAFISIEDTEKYTVTASSLAILYRNIEQYDSSLMLMKHNLSLSVQQSFPAYQVAMNHEGIAESFLGLNRQKNIRRYADSALQHYLSAYAIFKKTNDSSDMVWEASCIGRTLAALNQYSEAETYLLEALQVSAQLNMVNNQYDIANELYSLYEKTGDYKKAFSYLKLSKALSDSLSAITQVDKTNELKEKFESRKKEQEIKLLKTQNDLAVSDSRRARLIQYIFILLFTTAIAITLLLLNRLKIKRKLEAQMLRNQLASDLHDDIGSALSSIDISSRVALLQKNNYEMVETQLQKIRQQAHKTMESMSDIVWSIKPGNDTLEDTLAHMREFASELCEPLGIGLDFKTPQKENIFIGTDMRRNLFLIYKEAVNNAAKYSGCKNITTLLDIDNDMLTMKIEDDGKGFDPHTVKNGNGLTNMQTRAQHIHARIKIASQPGKGTAITLQYPHIGVK